MMASLTRSEAIRAMIMALCALTTHTSAAADFVLAGASNACPPNYQMITSNTKCKLAHHTQNFAEYQGKEIAASGRRAATSATVWTAAAMAHGSTSTARARRTAAPGCGAPKANTPKVPTPAQSYGGMLFAGDSNVEYWGTHYAFPGSSNTGVEGHTCKHVMQRLADQLEQHNPTELVLVCGENNMTSGASVQTAFACWKDALEKIMIKPYL